jgi:type IV pilus assembly protein PilQ
MTKTMLLFFTLVLSLGAHSQEIKSVNFFQEGEISKLVIELDKPVVAERFHVADDKQIILDVKNAKVDPKLLRGIDTSEFDGATVYVSGYPRPGAGNDVRFAIQLRDNVRSLLETQGNKLVLSIENRFGVFSRSKVEQAEFSNKESPEKGTGAVTDGVTLSVPKSTSLEDILENLTMSGPKKYVGKRISISVKDIPLKELLGMIAETSGFNIIIDSGVDKVPPMTLSLTNIPWDQALDTIMGLAKLVATKNANILTIKSLEQATAEREALAKAQQLKLGLEPLVTKVFPISYAELPSLTSIITDYLTKERGAIKTDERTNSLIIKDTVEVMERIKKIVELLDTQTPQILIESKIVEAVETHARSIGLTNGINFGYDPVRVSTTPAAGPGFNFSSTGRGTDTASGALNVNILSYKRLTNILLSLEMLESQSKVRIITSPKVITQNKKLATITSTEQTSFAVVTQNVAGTLTTFQQTPVTMNLGVTPQVTNEGSINMQVNLTKGSFGARPAPNAPPNTTTRVINTNVLVANGSTVVLGGLYTNTDSENHSGIPFLKDLPLVGWLFRTPHNPSRSRSELLIFLTPRIINQEEAGLTNRGANANSNL